MASTFSYTSSDNWRKKYKTHTLVMRIGGIYFLIGGLLYFSPWGWGWEGDMWDSVFAIGSIGFGLIACLPTNWLWKPKGEPYEYVIIEDGMLKWKEGKFKQKKELRFDEIASYQLFVGEVHLSTIKGEICKLKTYNIEDDDKQKELLHIISRQFASTEQAQVSLAQ